LLRETSAKSERQLRGMLPPQIAEGRPDEHDNDDCLTGRDGRIFFD
jgi:hypothetical protein